MKVEGSGASYYNQKIQDQQQKFRDHHRAQAEQFEKESAETEKHHKVTLNSIKENYIEQKNKQNAQQYEASLMADAQIRKRFEDLKEQNQVEIKEIHKEYALERDAVKEKHRVKLKQVKKAYEDIIAQKDRALEETERQNERRLAELRSRNAKDREELITNLNEKVDAMKVKHQKDIRKINEEFYG